jgi:predicted protein tyrosine phosphatase
VLFVCSRNRLRSPTAEAVFGDFPDVEVDSAGLAPDAEVALTPEAIEWADIVFVMEKSHLRKLRAKFAAQLLRKRIVCLDIPDRYPYMHPALVELLRARVSPRLQQR